jgi:hypothetical protein
VCRQRIYNYMVKVDPRTYSHPYIRFRCLTLEDALEKAKTEALRNGKAHYVCDAAGKLVQEFHFPKELAV